MDSQRLVKVSKYLSRHLRHQPGRIGLALDEAGWVEVAGLLAACARHSFPVGEEELRQVVAGNDKQRFAFDETGTRIRASQGHTVEVSLGLPVATPPDRLYHGTVERFAGAIRREGLRPMKRHDVHLSSDVETARKVGARRGRPVILKIDAAAMAAAGHEFRVSANGVWLVAYVPPGYIS